MIRALLQVVLVGAVLVLLPAMGAAQMRYAGTDPSGESPVGNAFELRLGWYQPAIDDEFGGTGPWDELFGARTRVMFELEYDRQLYRGIGSLGVGLHVGYFGITAKALNEDGSRSPDQTQFTALPTRVSAVYRFDLLQERFDVPLVPVAKLGLDYVFWWVGNDAGRAEVVDDGGERLRGQGGTSGWHASLAMHLLLDWFSQDMARTFDANMGVNNSYLFIEYMWTGIDDFGSSESWDLSDDMLMFGLAFEF